MATTPVTTQSVLNKSKKDKFLLVLNLPAILKSVNVDLQGARASNLLNLDSLQYSIHGTVVPKSSIPEVEIAFSGQTTKVTSYARASYDPITVNFAVDNLFSNYWVLWYWLNVINDSKQSVYNAKKLSPSDNFYGINTYQSKITVYGLDEYNNKVIQWDYSNAFITTLGDITYSYQDHEQIESSFTFAFGQLTSKLLTPAA